MEINGVKVKVIRPMTAEEISTHYWKEDNKCLSLFCIDLEDGTTIYPGNLCAEMMKKDLCIYKLMDDGRN